MTPTQAFIDALQEQEGVEVTFVLKVKATIVRHSNSHGSCFLLTLERRDYTSGREIWVDPDEIVDLELAPAEGVDG